MRNHKLSYELVSKRPSSNDEDMDSHGCSVFEITNILNFLAWLGLKMAFSQFFEKEFSEISEMSKKHHIFQDTNQWACLQEKF